MKISIITICYNNLEGLKLTAKSIASQKSQDFEWVVIDGASSDGTLSFLHGLKRKPDILISEPDKGIYDAMNKGMNAAHGEYQLYLNSGDYLYNSSIIKKMLNTTMTADVVYGDLEFIFPEHKGIGRYPHTINLYFMLYSALGHPSSFIKAERLKEIGGYDSNLKIVSDWKIWIEFYLRGFSFQHCGQTISSFVAGGISSTQPEMIIEERISTLRELFATNEKLNLMPEISIIIPYTKDSNDAKETLQNIHKQYYINIKNYNYPDECTYPPAGKYAITVSKEDSSNLEFIARKVEEFEYAEKANCIVGIPIYKEIPSKDEINSFRRCYDILCKQDIAIIAPIGIDLSYYEKIVNKTIKCYRFDKKYFEGIKGYNELMLSYDFYNTFNSYEYLLIYQLDAWVFQDELNMWCKKGYEYIGSPWFNKCLSHEEGEDLWCVGNGGLSLRNIKAFKRFTYPKTRAVNKIKLFKHECVLLCIIRDYIYGLFGKNDTTAEYYIKKWKKLGWNEDGIFSFVSDGTCLSLKRPSPEEASSFGIEASPAFLFKNNGCHLPFGCHAWRKFDYGTFWKYYINIKE